MQPSPADAAPPELRLVTSDGLVVQAASTPLSPVLGSFYEGYDQAFVLPNEKETLNGFAECLELNQGEAYRALSARHGAFREVVMVAHTADGQALGGANFIAYPLAGGPLCLNLNYIYVLPAQRRQGQFKALVRAVQQTGLAHFPQRGESTNSTPLLFIEQNDPLRMSPDEYARDTEYSGIDQVDRLAIWAKLGARVVDFAYVQPALSETQAADPNLVYSLLGADGSSLAACVLQAHLERFFAISVLKGNDLSSSPEASLQLAELALMCQRRAVLRLLDPAAALLRLRELGPQRFEHAGADSFRALAAAPSPP